MKNIETDTLQHTRNALTRVDVSFVEADQNTLEIESLFAVFQQLDEMVTRQTGGVGIVGQKKS